MPLIQGADDDDGQQIIHSVQNVSSIASILEVKWSLAGVTRATAAAASAHNDDVDDDESLAKARTR